MKRKIDGATSIMWFIPIFILTGPLGIILWFLFVFVYNKDVQDRNEAENFERTAPASQRHWLLVMNDPENLTEEEKNFIAKKPGLMKIKDRPEGMSVYGDVNSEVFKNGFDRNYWEYSYCYPRGSNCKKENVEYVTNHYICSNCLKIIEHIDWQSKDYFNEVRTVLRCPHCKQDVRVTFIPREMWNHKVFDLIHYFHWCNYDKSFLYKYYKYTYDQYDNLYNENCKKINKSLLIHLFDFKLIQEGFDIERKWLDKIIKENNNYKTYMVSRYVTGKNLYNGYESKYSEKYVTLFNRNLEEFIFWNEYALELNKKYIKMEQTVVLANLIRKVQKKKMEVID